VNKESDTLSKGRPLGELVTGLVIAIAVVYQLGVLWRGPAGQAIAAADRGLEGPAWKRAALYFAGEGFAEYIEFVREQTSPDSRIVLPPRIPERPESNVGLMQYYLFPRDIHNCGIGEVEECVKRIRGPNSYILALVDFPPRELALQTRRFIPFNKETGLFGPP
jgi:hypothetical protein